MCQATVISCHHGGIDGWGLSSDRRSRPRHRRPAAVVRRRSWGRRIGAGRPLCGFRRYRVLPQPRHQGRDPLLADLSEVIGKSLAERLSAPGHVRRPSQALKGLCACSRPSRGARRSHPRARRSGCTLGAVGPDRRRCPQRRQFAHSGRAPKAEGRRGARAPDGARRPPRGLRCSKAQTRRLTARSPGHRHATPAKRHSPGRVVGVAV